MLYLQECGDFTWRVSDCEELVGVTWRLSDSEDWWELLAGDDGDVLGGLLFVLYFSIYLFV